jgi:hypothetical protein
MEGRRPGIDVVRHPLVHSLRPPQGAAGQQQVI